MHTIRMTIQCGVGEKGIADQCIMLNLVNRLGMARVNVFRTFPAAIIFQAKSICWFCWMKNTIVLSIMNKVWVWEYHFIVTNIIKEWYYTCNFVQNMRRWWEYINKCINKFCTKYKWGKGDISTVHCKNRLTIFPSPAGMSLTKLSLAGNINSQYYTVLNMGERVRASVLDGIWGKSESISMVHYMRRGWEYQYSTRYEERVRISVWYAIWEEGESESISNVLNMRRGGERQ